MGVTLLLADPGGPAGMDFDDIPVPGSDSDQTVQYDDLYCKDLVISDDHQDWMFLTAEERLAAMTCSLSVCSTVEGSSVGIISMTSSPSDLSELGISEPDDTSSPSLDSSLAELSENVDNNPISASTRSLEQADRWKRRTRRAAYR